MKKKIILFFIIFINAQLIFCQSNINKVKYSYRVSNQLVDTETIVKEKSKSLKGAMSLLNESLKNYQNKLSYSLIFNKVESIFTMNKILDSDFDKQSKLAIALTKSKDVIYINLNEKAILKRVSSLGSEFNVKTDLNSQSWKLTQETNKIGEYLCFKAITESPHKKNRNIIAWYCPAIPYSFGPKEYAGLPGLILELEDDVLGITYYAKEIHLNLKEKMNIKFKNKDNFISQKELDSVLNLTTKNRFKKSNKN